MGTKKCIPSRLGKFSVKDDTGSVIVFEELRDIVCPLLCALLPWRHLRVLDEWMVKIPDLGLALSKCSVKLDAAVPLASG